MQLMSIATFRQEAYKQKQRARERETDETITTEKRICRIIKPTRNIKQTLIMELKLGTRLG